MHASLLEAEAGRAPQPAAAGLAAVRAVQQEHALFGTWRWGPGPRMLNTSGVSLRFVNDLKKKTYVRTGSLVL